MAEAAPLSVHTFGRFELQPAERRLLADGRPVSLGPRALDVLLVLVERAGRLVTKDELLQQVWPNLIVEENNLQAQVSALRKILGAEAIATVQGQGYRFTWAASCVPVTVQAAPQPRGHNLPRQLTSFIGRQREIAEIEGLLERSRLLTLTGLGGCGKTRLSLQIAADLLGQFADGAWFVELAALADPGLVAQAVATTLAVKEASGTGLTQVLIEHLEPKRLLLVFDNCEHVLEACATLADLIVRQCPGVVLLSTSRERLGLAGEQTYRVPALSLPDQTRVHTPMSVVTAESAQLFVDRALLVRPDFQITHAGAPALASLCGQLDGQPLAIELAAARVRSLTVEEIDSRLGQRFSLLTGGPRTAAHRHQSLRALIDWSHELLTEAERLLLQRLSVFAGGWTLEAAERVCADDRVPVPAVLDLLTSLSDKSLVVGEPASGHFRYRLLETVRQYACDRLHGAAQTAQWQRRHRAHFLDLAEGAEQAFTGTDQQVWLDRLETEHGNLRSALDGAVESGEDAASGLQLAGALLRFWSVRGYLAEGRGCLARLLAAATDAPGPVRAKALNAAGTLALEQGDYAASMSFHRQSLAISQDLGDTRGVTRSLNNLGVVAYECGDYPTAQALNSQTLAIRRELGDPWGVAASLNNLGVVAHAQCDHAAARSLYAESLAIRRALGDRSGIATSLHNLGLAASDQGDHASARTLFAESLLAFQELGYRRGLADALEALAYVGGSPSDPARAARIWGAAARLRTLIGAPLPPNERGRYDGRVATARAALGDDSAFDRAWQEGHDLPLDDVIGLALAWTDEPD